MEAYKSLRQGNLVDVVFSTIKQDIVRGKLKLGDRFPPQEKLAEQFGVSRTVIREAQKKLASLGLVENRQGSGTYVSHPRVDELIAPVLPLVGLDADNIAELMEARFHVELAISRMAAQRADDAQIERLKAIVNEMVEKTNQGGMEDIIQSDLDFHLELAAISRNRVLARMVETIREMTHRFLQSFYHTPGAPGRAIRDHMRVLEAVEARDPDLAEKEMRSHLAEIVEYIEIYFNIPLKMTDDKIKSPKV